MFETAISTAWQALVATQRACTECRTNCQPSLLDDRARPLFGRFTPWQKGLLFVFEAPNLEDTTNPAKGYLTYDRVTDPTGRFARTLMTEELGLDPDFFQVTNSVLCLPCARGDKFPVKAGQATRCSSRIRKQIEVLDPVVVVAVGAQALTSLQRIDKYEFRRLSEAVAVPKKWFGRWLFPVFHTGMLARNARGGRPEQLQRGDWRKLRQFLDSQGVQLPCRVHP